MTHREKSPKTAEEQDAPQQERMVTPQEEAGMDVAELENPPQAEGPRKRVEEDLRPGSGNGGE